MKRCLDIPVRVREVEIRNFKNVNKGKITFIKSDEKQDYENIIGLYGQNGSGKTTFVNALDLLKAYMGNEVIVLPFVNRIEEFYDYFSIGNGKSMIISKFDMVIKNKPIQVEYKLSFKSNAELKTYVIDSESLSFILNGEKEYIEYKLKKCVFSNGIKEQLGGAEADLSGTIPFAAVNLQSVFFNDFFVKTLKEKGPSSIIFDIIAQLKFFAKFDMFVITNRHFGLINLQWNIPFTFRYSKNREVIGLDNRKVKQEELTSGSQTIDLRQPQQVPTSFYEKLNSMLDNINEVLTRLIPDTKVEIIPIDCVMRDGSMGKSIELVTNRNGKKIPMRNESTGILKIVSIIQTLIAYCTCDDIFVAIDEFDAGIYEYLLGSLLELLSKEGKGQLFFSSHNLRPLEILNKNSIYFSTTNPDNRYIKFSNVKTNNNLRDFYFRTIVLGGQKEKVYNDDDMAGLQIILRKLARNE